MNLPLKYKPAIAKILKLLLPGQWYASYRNKFLFNQLSDPFPLYSIDEFQPSWNSLLPQENVNNAGIDSKPIIYLISPTQRSGTNYLSYLLSLHSQLQFPSGKNLPNEQFIYSYAEYLQEYIVKTISLWRKWIQDEQQLHIYAKLLIKNLGAGISDFFYSFIEEDKIMYLRSPDSKNIQNFFHLFPNGKVIILVRDGRDTVESFVKSWGTGAFKKMCIRWSDRIDAILQFIDVANKNNKSDSYLVVRYDELNNDTKNQMSRILNFLNLDHGGYDWNKMEEAPVLGSSTFKGEQLDVNWNPLKKDKNFNPHNKWEKWNARQKKIFKKYAGENLIQMNFAVDNSW